MKFTKYISVLLLIVSAILAVVFYTSGYSDGMVTTIINWALVLSAVALVGAVQVILLRVQELLQQSQLGNILMLD